MIGTIGYPIIGGIGDPGPEVAPLVATWLSMERFRKIVAGAVAPPHFFGSYSPAIFPLVDKCQTVLPRHGWQYNKIISREELKLQILESEKEIAEYLGFHLAPTFVTNELHGYPKPYDPTLIGSYGLNTPGHGLSLIAKSGKLLQSGARSTTPIDTATTTGGSLTYTDEDGDGFAETATITVATSITDVRELKVYIAGTSAAPEWEVREPRKKYISGGNLVVKFFSWQLIDPDVDGAFPTVEDYRAIDITTQDYFVTSVDIYREYIDNTQVSARFFWEDTGCANCGGSGCDACALIYQDGCAIVRDSQLGIVVPAIATYDDDNGIWRSSSWTVGRDPDQVRVSYYAGDMSQGYRDGSAIDPLKEMYAKAIAYMTAARLPRTICSCPGVVQFFEDLRADMALNTSNLSHLISMRDLDNPFGTRLGEIMAWKLLGKVNRDKMVEVAIV